MFNNTKIVSLPSKDFVPKLIAGKGSSLLTRAQLEGEIAEMNLFFMLVANEGDLVVKEDVPAIIQPLLEKFFEVFSTELSEGLPPLRDI